MKLYFEAESMNLTSFFVITLVRKRCRRISNKRVQVEVTMISILVIRRQSPVVIHLHDMEKLKDMVILRANACATLMVVGTLFTTPLSRKVCSL